MADGSDGFDVGTAVAGWFQTISLTSVGAALVAYFVAWYTDRQRLKVNEKVAHLKKQVACFGKVTHAFKESNACIKSYTVRFRKDAAKVCAELAEKHFHDWYREQIDEACGGVEAVRHKLQSEEAQESDEAVESVERVWRNLEKCPNVSPLFHQEIQEYLPMKVWFAHVRTTILRLNEVIEAELMTNRDLLPADAEQDGFSELVEDFMEYAADYRRMVQLWDVGDFTLTMVKSRFPQALPNAIGKLFTDSLTKLKGYTYELEDISTGLCRLCMSNVVMSKILSIFQCCAPSKHATHTLSPGDGSRAEFEDGPEASPICKSNSTNGQPPTFSQWHPTAVRDFCQ